MAVQMVIGNITRAFPKDLVSGATTMPSAIVTQFRRRRFHRSAAR